MGKSTEICKILIFYNVHNRAIPWKTLQKLLPKLKKKKYTSLLWEFPYDYDFSLYQETAEDIKRHPRKRNMWFDYLRKPDDIFKHFREIKDIHSLYVKQLLDVFNDWAAGNPHAEQGLQIAENTKITTPISIERLRELRKEDQIWIIQELKKVALYIGQSTGEDEMTITLIDAFSKGFKNFGIDSAYECERADFSCRDGFMTDQIKNACTTTSKNLVAVVGTGHYGVGQVLSKNSTIATKQCYVVDYSESNSPDEGYIRYDPGAAEIEVIDTREENAVEKILAVLNDLEGCSQGEEL